MSAADVIATVLRGITDFEVTADQVKVHYEADGYTYIDINDVPILQQDYAFGYVFELTLKNCLAEGVGGGVTSAPFLATEDGVSMRIRIKPAGEKMDLTPLIEKLSPQTVIGSFPSFRPYCEMILGERTAPSSSKGPTR